MALKFPFYECKAIEVLALIAQLRQGLTPLYVSKVLFYAEKWHLNRYGRPICADTYIAMPMGPVPSTIKNFIDRNWRWTPKPADLDGAVQIDDSEGLARLMPGQRAPDLSILSASDVDCIMEAVDFCADVAPGDLSRMTHSEKAWLEADANQPMDYEMFIDDDNPHKAEILNMAREISVHGVL